MNGKRSTFARMTSLDAVAKSMASPEEEAKIAMRLAFPGLQTACGEMDCGTSVGFGVVFSKGRRHAVRVKSWADVHTAIGQLKAWAEQAA